MNKGLIRSNIRLSGINENMYKNKTFQNFTPGNGISKKVMQSLQKYTESYSEENNKGLLLWGDNGLGKTHIAIAIAYQLLLMGYKVKYFNPFSLYPEIKQTFHNNEGITETQIIDKYLKAAIVVIDDIMIRTDWEKSIIQQIIGYRYYHNKTIIVTCNYNVLFKANSDWDMLVNIVGKFIYSRLFKMCYMIEFEGQDYRMRDYLKENKSQ